MTPPLLPCPHCRRAVRTLELLAPTLGGVDPAPRLVCPPCAFAARARQLGADVLARW